MSETFFVQYNNENYNIHGFLNKHPGGRSILEKYEDADITRAYDDIDHSDYAKGMLDSYKTTTVAAKPVGKKALTRDAKFILKKLFTKEDKTQVHKILGLLALISYCYRYFYVLPTTGTLGFTGTSFDYWTLVLHFMLSASAMIFHVVERRIVSNPLIIYQEYRLHAIVFTAKACLVSVIGLNLHLMSNTTAKIVMTLFTLSTHGLVDYITSLFGTPGISTVRNDDNGTLAELKLFFSFYQVMAMASMLIVDDNLCDLGFNALIAIQSSAVLMTLKRKSLIRSSSHLFWYSLALFLSLAYMWKAMGPMFFLKIAALFTLKIELNLNKYLMWGTYALVAYSAVDSSALLSQ